MARYRRRSKPLWLTFPLWVVVTFLVGWGLWQFTQFRHTLIAQAQQPLATTDPAPSPPPVPPAVSTSSTSAATSAFADATDLQNATPTGDSLLSPTIPSVPENPPLPPQNPDDLTAKALACLDAGRIIEGRSDLNTALNILQDDLRADVIRQQLAALNAGVFLGSAVLPEDPIAKYVDIERGDSFLKFAHEYKVPAAFLESINPNLNPRNLKPTTGVKIVRGPFNLRLIKHSSRLDLYIRELYVRSFDAQLEEGNYLPRGDYRIKSGAKIQVNTRQWIGFEGIDSATRDISSGWIYGSAGVRGGSSNDATGIKVEDTVLQQLYTVLVETHSTLHVLP